MNEGANVTQFLSMFNGFVEGQLLQNPKSELIKHLSSAKSADDKCDVVFLSTLGRLPTDEERAAVVAQSGPDGNTDSQQDLVWALLNSQEFVFVE